MEDREVCGLISSCCPRNPHGKAGNDERSKKSVVLRQRDVPKKYFENTDMGAQVAVRAGRSLLGPT